MRLEWVGFLPLYAGKQADGTVICVEQEVLTDQLTLLTLQLEEAHPELSFVSCYARAWTHLIQADSWKLGDAGVTVWTPQYAVQKEANNAL